MHYTCRLLNCFVVVVVVSVLLGQQGWNGLVYLSVRHHHRIFTQVLQMGKLKHWEVTRLGQGPTTSNWRDFPGNSVWLLVANTLKWEWSWLNWTCMGFRTSSPQQHELHDFGDALMQCLALCRHNRERWEIATGPVSVPRGHNDWANGPWSLRPGSDLSALTPTLTDSPDILLK